MVRQFDACILCGHSKLAFFRSIILRSRLLWQDDRVLTRCRATYKGVWHQGTSKVQAVVSQEAWKRECMARERARKTVASSPCQLFVCGLCEKKKKEEENEKQFFQYSAYVTKTKKKTKKETKKKSKQTRYED